MGNLYNGIEPDQLGILPCGHQTWHVEIPFLKNPEGRGIILGYWEEYEGMQQKLGMHNR